MTLHGLKWQERAGMAGNNKKWMEMARLAKCLEMVGMSRTGQKRIKTAINNQKVCTRLLLVVNCCNTCKWQ